MFGKWFASTYTGSMLGAGGTTFAVWGWIIANADRKGVLEINPRLLAAIIGDPIEDVRRALDYLSAPDEESRSTAEGGRRIVHVNAFTWQVVNHEHYRKLRNADERREYNRIKKAESRARASVDCQQSQPRSAHAEAEEEAEEEAESTPRECEVAEDPEVLTPSQAQAAELASYLLEAIRSHSPEFKSAKTPAQTFKMLSGWADPIEKLIRLDGKSPEHIRAVIDRCHRDPSDDFEHGNIQSGAKLRKRWDQLWAKTKARRPRIAFSAAREGTVFA